MGVRSPNAHACQAHASPKLSQIGLCQMNHRALTCIIILKKKFFFSLSSIFKPLRVHFDYAFSASRSALKAGALLILNKS